MSTIRTLSTEKTFGIYFNDIYNTYSEITNRKINMTKYLDSLKDGIIKRTQDYDEIQKKMIRNP